MYTLGFRTTAVDVILHAATAEIQHTKYYWHVLPVTPMAVSARFLCQVGFVMASSDTQSYLVKEFHTLLEAFLLRPAPGTPTQHLVDSWDVSGCIIQYAVRRLPITASSTCFLIVTLQHEFCTQKSWS